MPDPREVLAAALAEQSPDDDDLRDWLTDRAEFVEDALAAAGIHLCTEGQAVVDGQVVKVDVTRSQRIVTRNAEEYKDTTHAQGLWQAGIEERLSDLNLHVCAEGQAVVDGAVVTLQRGAIDAYDSPLGPNFIEFYADTAGDYFRIEEAPDAR